MSTPSGRERLLKDFVEENLYGLDSVIFGEVLSILPPPLSLNQRGHRQGSQDIPAGQTWIPASSSSPCAREVLSGGLTTPGPLSLPSPATPSLAESPARLSSASLFTPEAISALMALGGEECSPMGSPPHGKPRTSDPPGRPAPGAAPGTRADTHLHV